MIPKLMEEKVKEHSLVDTAWYLKSHSLKDEDKNGTLVVSLLKGSSPPRSVYCTVAQCGEIIISWVVPEALYKKQNIYKTNRE